jgi:hypothetical protein
MSSGHVHGLGGHGQLDPTRKERETKWRIRDSQRDGVRSWNDAVQGPAIGRQRPAAGTARGAPDTLLVAAMMGCSSSVPC